MCRSRAGSAEAPYERSRADRSVGRSLRSGLTCGQSELVAETAEHYLRDLGTLIVGLANERDRSESADYDAGRRMAFYEVVTLMQQQAVAFGLTADQVGLGGVVPESDILCGDA